MRTIKLQSLIGHAIQYALLSAAVGCGTQSADSDTDDTARTTGASNADDEASDDTSSSADDDSSSDETSGDDDDDAASDDTSGDDDETSDDGSGDDGSGDDDDASDDSSGDDASGDDDDVASDDGSGDDGSASDDASGDDDDVASDDASGDDDDAASDDGSGDDDVASDDASSDDDDVSDDAASDDASDDDDSSEPPQWETLECPAEGTSAFEDMNLTTDYDVIERRTAWPSLPSGVSLSDTIDDSHGTACATASDEEACNLAMADAWPDSDGEWFRCEQVGCSYTGLVVNLGDDVELAQTLDAIFAILGDIDTLEEAVLWGQANGYTITCGYSQVQAAEVGFRFATEEQVSDCPVQMADVTFNVLPDGTIDETSRELQPETNVCIGRRPSTMSGIDHDCSNPDAVADEVGEYFAEVAALEAAAVEAFSHMMDELRRFGAPTGLIDAAARARSDEQRHARVTATLARRYGVQPSTPRGPSPQERDLYAFALENVIEGCVRETFGAAYAAHQAVVAKDPAVRFALRSIALDETRHAELSWCIHAWVLPRLTVEQIASLQSAMRDAVAKLRDESLAPVPERVQSLAGVPGSAAALALLDDLEANLWREAARAA